MPSFRSLIRVSTGADDIYLRQQQEQQKQGSQQQQQTLAHVDDLLDHSWHYDCVVSPKHNFNNNNTSSDNQGKPSGCSTVIDSTGLHVSPSQSSVDAVIREHNSSVARNLTGVTDPSNATLVLGTASSKPLSIIKYPSLSSDTGYISLATFIKNSANSSSFCSKNASHHIRC